ncbi:segregation/condensation protein A [Streptomyces sp. ISL-12]|uniref:segregation and condensation protein A n=1 Tax=Streptomyces sp. ISL-12 TaxID=2819177 RepID=UPI0027E0F141|nr:segregation/condensation protein A [Streptomyces sp. ISL-12]
MDAEPAEVVAGPGSPDAVAHAAPEAEPADHGRARPAAAPEAAPRAPHARPETAPGTGRGAPAVTESGAAADGDGEADDRVFKVRVAHAAPEADPADHGRARPAAAPEAEPRVPHVRPETAPGTGRGAPAVTESGAAAEGDGEADDRVFKVRLANFEGPFDLLLQLISKHKMDVTEVALSKVTDEFMAHIRALGPDGDLDRTTEFLVVAATLLDLKAARLLPAAEVEDEADLALLEARDLLFARLLQYRAYKRIADIFSGRLDDEARRCPRTVGLEPHHAELLPDVVISIGAEGFAKLAVKAMQPKPKPQVYVEHIHAPLVSVREQAGIVVARLKELGEASFRALTADTDDTLTVVARFLALLELYREKAVALDQETALGELLVRWTGGDGAAEGAVTDEFDRPPEQPEEEKST